MTTEIQSQFEWLVPAIQSLGLESLKLQTVVMEKEAELKASSLYIELQEAKTKLQANEAQTTALREQGKDLMIQSGLKKIALLDGTEIQLNKTPWSLFVGEGVQLGDEWYKVTKSLDKTKIKKAFNEGVQFPEEVYIESDYSFVIKSK